MLSVFGHKKSGSETHFRRHRLGVRTASEDNRNAARSQDLRGLANSAVSSSSVTGPSLTSVTCMFAPNRPRSTRAPLAANAAA